MKISDLVSQQLIVMGVERPSLRLIEEAERLVIKRVTKVIHVTLKPKVVAKAFAATLIQSQSEKGLIGESSTDSLIQAVK